MRNSKARNLRKRQTEAEKKIWLTIRNRQLGGFKFRRQVSFGPYVADFVCHEAKLIFEIDGGQHATNQEPENRRTRFLEDQGYRVIRFWNNEVFENLEGVLERLKKELELPLT